MATIYVTITQRLVVPLNVTTDTPYSAGFPALFCIGNCSNIKTPTATPNLNVPAIGGSGIAYAPPSNPSAAQFSPGASVQKGAVLQGFSVNSAAGAFGLGMIAFKSAGPPYPSSVITGTNVIIDPQVGAVQTNQQLVSRPSLDDFQISLNSTPLTGVAPAYYPSDTVYYQLANAGYDIAGQGVVNLTNVLSIIGSSLVADVNVTPPTIWSGAAAWNRNIGDACTEAGLNGQRAIVVAAVKQLAISIPDAALQSTGAQSTDYLLRVSPALNVGTWFSDQSFYGGSSIIPKQLIPQLAIGNVANTCGAFFVQLPKLSALKTVTMASSEVNESIYADAAPATVGVNFYGGTLDSTVTVSLSSIVNQVLPSIGAFSTATPSPHS